MAAHRFLRFADETVQAPAEVLGMGLGDRVNAEVPLPHGKLDGQVLLDGHLLIEIGVVSEIGNPEAALTEYSLDAIPVDEVARLERVAMKWIGHGEQV